MSVKNKLYLIVKTINVYFSLITNFFNFVSQSSGRKKAQPIFHNFI
jgi:hypothetical protein